LLIRKLIAGLVFIAIFLGLLASAHYYLVHRIALDPAWPKGAAIALISMMVLGSGALIVHGLLWRRLGVAARPISWVAYVWLGLLFYLLVSAASLDLATVGLGLAGEEFEELVSSTAYLRGRALMILAIATLASGFALARGTAAPITKRIDIALENFPESLDGFRIVQISDIHIGPMLDRRFSKLLVDRVDALKPDLIAVTGDLVDGRVSHLEDEVAPFRDLSAPHGVYFVTGNHDYYSGADEWTEHVMSFGWRPLRNESTTIERDGGQFSLVGVDDPHGAMLNGHGGEDLALALRDVNPSHATVLLAHDPATFRRTKKTHVGLQISGHTHGGQIWPFRWAVRAVTPWVAGHYHVGDHQIYVSCGTGYWGPPMRLGTRAEITEFTFTRAISD